MLINLPPTRHRGGRLHFSNNDGDGEADDADVGEDSISNNTDDAANDVNKEDNSDHDDDKEDNEDEDNDLMDILFSTIVAII